tara:strand:+ start:1230 stop:3218 length:1989 start_codon:yes stop_codon:yes gene_type:complete
MNHFLKKVVVLFILAGSVNLFAQQDNLAEKQKKPFNPKFTLGSGIYTLTGDIKNEDSGLIKGKAGFNAGMKFDISNNIDLSFLIIKMSFSGSNGDETFSSGVDGFGLNLGYTINQLFKKSKISPTLSLGVQKLDASTTITTIDGEEQEMASAIAIPLGIGMRMNVTERLQFDVVMNFGIGMSDIDMSKINEGNPDGYKSLNFAIHYDLFTPNRNSVDDFDDSYYADVDFAKLESEDEDGDLVRDMDDYCPQTPIGVQVDKNGCPLDDDKDGIANYLDDQKNTPEGSIVDENGVRLTAEKYQSMYSDFEIASRKYANFYNEVEIKRENYKTVDEYLIAKANAFNKAFNESMKDGSKVAALIYRVKIGEYKEGIDARTTNKLLSLDDLESLTQKDDVVIYAVGSYTTLEEARDRLYVMEKQGFGNTCIIVDNNGEISNYVEPIPEPEIIDEEEIVMTPEETNTNDKLEESLVKEVKESTYRIQIGAFNKPLPDEVFVGVNNVISFTGKDRLVRYMTGSFTSYKDAVDYQAQMKARGFEDAFIVTYKNGKRISLNVAMKPRVTTLSINETKSNELDIDFEFTVQIMVTEASVSASDFNKMSKLGNIEKEQSGSLYKYYAGTYLNLEEANIQLEKAKLAGFSDAFVFAIKNGERIILEEAKELLEE